MNQNYTSACLRLCIRKLEILRDLRDLVAEDISGGVKAITESSRAEQRNSETAKETALGRQTGRWAATPRRG